MYDFHHLRKYSHSKSAAERFATFSTYHRDHYIPKDDQRTSLINQLISKEKTDNFKYKNGHFNVCQISSSNIRTYLETLTEENGNGENFHGTFYVIGDDMSGIFTGLITPAVWKEVTKPTLHSFKCDAAFEIKNYQYKLLTTYERTEWFFQRASTRNCIEGGLKHGNPCKVFGDHAVQGEQLAQTVLQSDMYYHNHPRVLDAGLFNNVTNISAHDLRRTKVGVLLKARLIGKGGNKYYMGVAAHENLYTNHIFCYGVDLNPKRNIIPDIAKKHVENIAKIHLITQYYQCIRVAIQNTPENKTVGIVLTMLGTGSFKNDETWAAKAIVVAQTVVRNQYPQRDIILKIVYDTLKDDNLEILSKLNNRDFCLNLTANYLAEFMFHA